MDEYFKVSEKEGLRGPELIEWANYIDKGGLIYPLSVLSIEGSSVEEYSNS